MGAANPSGHAPAAAHRLKREQIVLSLRGLVTVRGEIDQNDLTSFFTRAHGFVSAWRLGVILCDVEALSHPDLRALDGLARIRLFVRKHGKEMKLRSAGTGLCELLDFTGFRECLPRAEPYECSERD